MKYGNYIVSALFFILLLFLLTYGKDYSPNLSYDDPGYESSSGVGHPLWND